MGRRFNVVYEVTNRNEYVGNAGDDLPDYRCDYSACGFCVRYETVCNPANIIVKFLLENTPEVDHEVILRSAGDPVTVIM